MSTEATTVHEIEHARRRVSVGPMPEWAVLHAVDETWRAPGGAPSSLLLEDVQRHATRNEVFIRQVQRLETLHAVHELAQWTHDFDPATQRIVLHALTVRRVGSESDHALPEKFRFLQREARLESLVINGAVSLLVLLENVHVGDVLEVALTIVQEPRMFADHCSALGFPNPTLAIRHWRWSVRFDASRPMRWKAGPEDFKPEILALPNGDLEWVWSLEKTTAELPEPDVPSSCLPPRWVQISDFTSWAEVAAGFQAHWQEDWQSEELRDFVARIAEQAPTLAQRVALALSTLQDEIRYLSVNIELGGSIPAAPTSVLQKSFGDCKDKSFLLVHVLRCLGAPARPILVHTRLRGTIDELLPTPAFNHAIVEYELGAHRMWVDPTRSLQGGDAFSRFIPNFVVGLPIGPGVEALEAQPALGKPGRLTLHEYFGIDEAAGQSRMVMMLRGTGSEADALRARVLMHSAEAFAEERLHIYRQFFPRARLLGQIEWRDDRQRNEFRVGMHIALPITGNSSEDSSVSSFSYSAHLIRAGLNTPSLESRRFPLQVSGERVILEHIIEMMATRSQDTRDAFQAKHDAFLFSGIRENRLNAHVLRFSLSIHKDQIRAAELRSYRVQFEKMWAATAVKLFIFRGFKTAVVAKKVNSLFPNDRPEPAPMPVPASVPLPLEPVAALGPRALAPSTLEPVDWDAIKARRTASPSPQPPPPPRAEAATQRSVPPQEERPAAPGPSSRRRRRKRREISQIWILLVLGGAALAAAILALLLH